MDLSVSDFSSPATLTEAFKLMEQCATRIVAGGTDVIPSIRDGRISNVHLLDITRLGLDSIWIDEEYLHIGSTCTHSYLYEHALVKDYLPSLALACRKVGSKQIQNRGTIGGNIINASPAGDTLPVLVAVGAEVILVSEDKERVKPIESFCLGPGCTDLNRGEILREIRIVKQFWDGEFIKIGKRSALSISVASAAIMRDEDDCVYVACGSVDKTVKRCPSLEQLLNGADVIKPEDIYDAVVCDTAPIDDVRASAAYRQEVLSNVIYQHYIDCLMED